MLSLLVAASTMFAAVNLNTASKADAIIEYRKANKFNSIEDLKNVNGIGDKTFENLKSEISTSGETKIDETKAKAKSKKDELKEKVSKKSSEVKEKKDNAEDKVKEKKEKVKKETKSKAKEKIEK